jgi:tRNA pseudouridine38-40 synthase
VHARRQLLTFRVRQELPCPATLAALNAALPRSVRALSLRAVGPSFHARASPHLREYRYRVRLGGPPSRFAWSLPDSRSLPQPPERFDPLAARAFLAGLQGRHDRTPHTTRPEGPKVTRLETAELDERPRGGLLFRFVGDGFTRHLVRNWVWAAVARGCGVTTTHESSRGWRGPQAPGHGLILWDLVYPDEPNLF